MTQSNLADFGADVPEAEDDSSTPGGSGEEDGVQGTVRADTLAYQHMAPNADPDDPESCPWCCCPDLSRDVSPGDSLACTHCDAMIPEDADWYTDGEKIAI